MEYFTFNKDTDNRWYINLPTWTGDKAELEMVQGADSLLDILAQGEDYVDVSISLEPYNGYKFHLEFIEDESEGGTYKMISPLYKFNVWLCHVTSFVFGHLPKNIYVA